MVSVEALEGTRRKAGTQLCYGMRQPVRGTRLREYMHAASLAVLAVPYLSRIEKRLCENWPAQQMHAHKAQLFGASSHRSVRPASTAYSQLGKRACKAAR